jgi:hypothetical protein
LSFRTAKAKTCVVARSRLLGDLGVAAGDFTPRREAKGMMDYVLDDLRGGDSVVPARWRAARNVAAQICGRHGLVFELHRAE